MKKFYSGLLIVGAIIGLQSISYGAAAAEPKRMVVSANDIEKVFQDYNTPDLTIYRATLKSDAFGANTYLSAVKYHRIKGEDSEKFFLNYKDGSRDRLIFPPYYEMLAKMYNKQSNEEKAKKEKEDDKNSEESCVHAPGGPK